MKSNRSNPFTRALRQTCLTSVAALNIVGTHSASAAAIYWDIDSATVGAGGATPSGNWADANWSTGPDGDAVTGNWVDGLDEAIFSAGSDATGTFTVTATGTHIIGGFTVTEGTPTISGGGRFNWPREPRHSPSPGTRSSTRRSPERDPASTNGAAGT